MKPTTIRMDKYSMAQLRFDAALYPERGYWRPSVRGECTGERPCPYVSCQYHLALDVTAVGNLKLNFPDLEVWEMDETCVLDVAGRGGATLEEVGRCMNLSKPRTQVVEAGCLERMRGDLAGVDCTEEHRRELPSVRLDAY